MTAVETVCIISQPIILVMWVWVGAFVCMRACMCVFVCMRACMCVFACFVKQTVPVFLTRVYMSKYMLVSG